jgi:hypothetical protein
LSIAGLVMAETGGYGSHLADGVYISTNSGQKP